MEAGWSKITSTVPVMLARALASYARIHVYADLPPASGRALRQARR
jgi:hypothetical protein